MYTDGLVEAMDADENEFDESRLIDVVQRYKEESASAINQHIRRAVKTHIGKQPLQDDFTLMVIKAVHKAPQ